MTEYLKKMPPSDLVSEKAILGLIMIDENRAKEILPLCKPEYFYSDKNKRILETMIVLSSTGTAIDLVTVSAQLDGDVSATYISSLLEGLPKSASVGAYLTTIIEKYRCRQVMEQCQRVMEKAVTGDYGTTIDTLARFDMDEFKALSEKTITKKARDWIELASGYFSISDIYRELAIISPADKNKIRVHLHKLCKQSILDKHPQRSGVYRRIEEESEPLDWVNASEDEYALVLPLGLNKMVQILPRSIVTIAGTPNVGKTALLLEVVRLNMERLKIHYFTSELGASKLKHRLKLFTNVDFPAGWTFQPWFRTGNWGDAVRQNPNDLTIIDFVEVCADAFMVGDIIKSVFDKLDKGVAIMAIQKKFGAELGRGAEFSLEKPSLYLSMDRGVIKIVKAKEWRGDDNPNGKMLKFSLRHGSEFISQGEWMSQEAWDEIDGKKPKKWSIG